MSNKNAGLEIILANSHRLESTKKAVEHTAENVKAAEDAVSRSEETLKKDKINLELARKRHRDAQADYNDAEKSLKHATKTWAADLDEEDELNPSDVDSVSKKRSHDDDGSHQDESESNENSQSVVAEKRGIHLVRVANKHGKITTKGKRARVCQITCLICRLWETTKNTQWKCADCGMGLCPQSVSRADSDIGRQYECLMEHQLSKVEGVRCGKVQKERHKIATAMREYQRRRVELFEGEFIL
jgi:hypothetical protein